MKKSSVVVLTLAALLTVSSCAVQKATDPQDPMYAEQMSDTTRHYLNDTTRMQAPQYNYYYRSYFWDDLYRIFFTRKYYQAINRPGYVPRHIRPPRPGTSGHGRSSTPHRGGFGHHGITHTPIS
jgi:hypothetical protein